MLNANIIRTKNTTGRTSLLHTTNIIITTLLSSDLPRAVSGNLTVDMFGQAVNLLDFGARVEGLETVLMKYFEEYLPEDMKTKPKAKVRK